MDGQFYRDLIRPVVAGRRFLIAADVLQAATPLAAELHDLGADRPFVLAAAMGTGDLPDRDHAEWLVVGTSGTTVMEAMRAADQALQQPPADAQAQIDAWDPHGTALALTWFLGDDATVAGRPSYGARFAKWAVIEDKMIIDAMWDAVGVPRVSSLIVPSDGDALRSAGAELDAGHGTAWVADNKEGWHGGGEYLRWVKTAGDAAEAVDFFAAHADRVRVMPFLDGVPCSIHGMVFPETVLAFNPVEMVILRAAGERRLVYAGVSTWWDAPEEAAEQMRAAVRATGAHLRATAGYRGGFSIDGVLTADGFRPTELNPRFSIGLGMQMAAVEHMPDMLNRCLVAGEDLDYRPAELEAVVRGAAATTRRGGAHVVVPGQREQTDEQAVAFREGRAVPVNDESSAEATLTFGPGPTGGYVRLRPNPENAPMGEWMAERAVAAFTLADELWDTGIGPLETARPA